MLIDNIAKEAISFRAKKNTVIKVKEQNDNKKFSLFTKIKQNSAQTSGRSSHNTSTEKDLISHGRKKPQTPRYNPYN